MIRKIPIADIPRANMPGHSIYPTLAEWEPLVEVVCKGLGPKDAYEVELSEETKRTLRTKKPHTQFVVAFKKRIDRKQWRYQIYGRSGKVYVHGLPDGRGRPKGVAT